MDPDWNAAIFRLHTLLQDGAGRLVVASNAPPASLPFTLPDLRSRLLAADVHQLTELDEAGQCEALRLRAASRGLELSEEAALYLVHRLPRDMHSLFAVLDQLDEASLAAQRKLTVPFLRTALEKGIGDRGEGFGVSRNGVANCGGSVTESSWCSCQIRLESRQSRLRTIGQKQSLAAAVGTAVVPHAPGGRVIATTESGRAAWWGPTG
jgi:hypothetical protein